MGLLFVALIAGCSAGPKGPSSAVTACRQHFPSVKMAEWTTAGVVRQEVGPVGRNGPPRGSLDRYPASERVVLCLVPNGDGNYAAQAVVTRTGEVDKWWVQNIHDRLTPPG